MSDLDALYTRLRSYSAKGHRDRDYLDRVKMLPCLVCGKTPSDPHHFFSGFHGRKTSDYHVVPLCRDHHEEAEADTRKYRFEMFVSLVVLLTERSA